jgi:hemerythrin
MRAGSSAASAARVDVPRSRCRPGQRERAAMPFMHWTDDLSVGVESLDTDHKVLMSLINQLDEALARNEARASVASVLDALADYTRYHFEREEALMAACGYPDLDAHVEIHRSMRAQVEDIRQRFDSDGETFEPRDVLGFLKNWLTQHIMGRDQLYAPFLTRERVAETEQPGR